MVRYDSGFVEVADRVWLARYEWHDVNVTIVEGSEGAVLIDTHASQSAARQVLEDARRAGLGNLVAIVNTHEHFDHTMGNGYLRQSIGSVPIYATREAAARTAMSAERFKERLAGSALTDRRDRDFLDTESFPADEHVDDTLILDLGDRTLELMHPGRGHTGGDLVVWIDDCGALVAGDLVEQTGPPVYVDNCFPLDWPVTMSALLGRMGSSSVVIPGHGQPTDSAFVAQQADGLKQVASTLRALASERVPLSVAAAEGDWPWPSDDWRFSHAIARGFAQLGHLV